MKKKNFKAVPASIRAKLETFKTNFVEVCSIEKINSNNVDKYENLGISYANGKIVIPKEPILSKFNNGKYSKYNVIGRTIVRKDLPKETRYVFYRVTDWHGDEHTGTYPRLVWQREIWLPKMLTISIEIVKELPNETVVKISIEGLINKTAKSFEHDLLFKINLLQENLGNCDVFEANCSEEEYIKTTYIDWQIFPPGEKDAREVFNSIPNTADRISFEEFEDRYNTIVNSKPIEMINSVGKFSGYFGAKFKNNIVVFENPRKNNALYAIHSNWEEISQTPRSELIKINPGNRNFTRIVHNKHWKAAFFKAIE